MINPEITTGWVCIASSGPTVSEKEIKPEWLVDMASSYDPEFYTATMWPEHNRTEPMGHVMALKSAVENGITKLFAVLKPNLALIEVNKEGRLCFCSIEPRPNFAKSGKMYLAALGLTDTPDSTGTTALKFSAQGVTPRGVPMQWAGSYAEKRDNDFFNLLTHGAQEINKSFLHIQTMASDLAKQFSATNTPTSEPVKMDINTITRDFRFSFSQRDGFLDPVASAALTSALAQSSPLLSRITFIHVPDPYASQFDGFKPGLRTGRRTGERFEVKASPSHTPPELNEMDSGTVFSWDELSQILGRMTQQQANEVLQGLMLIAVAEDIIRIGFHGIAAESETDPAAHPNGEDVARGWHQTAKDADKAGERVLLAPVVFDVKGRGDYADLDAMAYHLVNKLPEAYRDDPRLVVLVGGELLRAHKQAYITPGQVRDKDQRMKIADMPVMTNQNMPSNYFAITFLENLRVITEENSERVNATDVNDSRAWAMRYYRHSGYSLGEPKAYAAFDVISIAK